MFVKGQKKIAGRKAGTKNKRKSVLDRFNDKYPEFSPLDELYKFATDEHNPSDDRIRANVTLASFLVPKPKPTDIPQPIPADMPWNDKKAAVDLLLELVEQGELSESRATEIVNLMHIGIQTSDMAEVAERLKAVEAELAIKKNDFLR